MKFVTFFFLTTFIATQVISLFGKNPSENGIRYRLLLWSDFKERPPTDDQAIAARTTTELEFLTTEYDGRYTYRVNCYFLPFSSYVRVRSDQNLRHEQTHFQIGYIAALMCQSDLAPLQQGDSAARALAESIFNRYSAMKLDLNEKFDEATGHGLNLPVEKMWEMRIASQLKRLSHGR